MRCGRPQVLNAIRTKMTGETRVRLFVKERRLAYYQAKYRKVPHVEVCTGRREAAGLQARRARASERERA